MTSGQNSCSTSIVSVNNRIRKIRPRFTKLMRLTELERSHLTGPHLLLRAVGPRPSTATMVFIHVAVTTTTTEIVITIRATGTTTIMGEATNNIKINSKITTTIIHSGASSICAYPLIAGSSQSDGVLRSHLSTIFHFPGHGAGSYPNRYQSRPNSQVPVFASFSAGETNGSVWYSDSAAASHMTPSKDVVIPASGDIEDTRIWRLAPNGTFSIKSSYHMIIEVPEDNGPNMVKWKTIWKVEVSERIRTFLWLAARGRIMTNGHLYKCHLRQDSGCEVCGAALEDIVHVIRDCPTVVQLWRCFLQTDEMASFFNLDKASWLKNNLQSTALWEDNNKWSSTFALICWWLWKWRFSRVHGDDIPPEQQCRDFIARKVHENTHA